MAGAGIAAAVRRRRVLAFLTLLVAIGLFYAVRHIQGGDGADEQSGVILAIAAFMNFVGWIVGLLIGKLTARFTSRRPRSR